MNKNELIILLVCLSLMSVQLVYANVPTVTDLEISAATDGELLTVTINHSGPTNNHYVSKVEVRLGENTETYELEPQSTVTFTEEFVLPETGTVEVRALCNLHGWSSWVSIDASTGETVPVEDSSSGIPGFPLAALGIGLALTLRREW